MSQWIMWEVSALFENIGQLTDALTAALQLSDRYVHDRMRPDRALDALDEACAHAQATITYSARAERLIEAASAFIHRHNQETRA